MQHYSHDLAPHPQETRTSGKKRKRSEQSRSDGPAPPKQQQTISGLFSASQQKQSVVSKRLPDDSVPPQSGKRPKSDPLLACVATAQIIPPDKMYNFTTPKSGGVVDLTGSPTSPPSRGSGRRMSSVQRTSNFATPTGPKRLTIKNLRAGSKSDPNEYFVKTWAQLDAALAAIFNNEQLQLSMEELYRGVENLCRQGKAAEVSQRLSSRCRAHVGGPLKQPLLDKAGEKNVNVLRSVLVAWQNWNNQVITLRSIFFYMDRSYLLQTSNPPIQDMAVALFRTLIFGDFILKDKILDGACDLLASHRRQDALDHDTFKEAIRMFHELSVYTSEFEPRMLGLSQSFIASWAERESSAKPLAEYVRNAHKLIETEMARCETFDLDSTTKQDLLMLLEDHLIQRREVYLVQQDEVGNLLDENAVEALEQLYSLLQRRRLGVKLRPPFEKWIIDTGSSIVFDEKGEDQMVVRLLSLKRQLDNIHRVAFHKHEELGHALREAFETFINKSKKTNATWGTDNSKPGEMIAKYVDMLLRGGVKAIPASLASGLTSAPAAEDEDNEEAATGEESAINAQLDQVLDLFRFVHGKAVFEAFYKKDLARRLLMERSADADAERSMLTRLKTECGAGFTQNLEQMFKDIELAREEMNAYKMMLQEKQLRPDIDLSAKILSAAAWPSYSDVPVAIPNEIRKAIEDFEKYYQLKHSGRKLDWKHALAHCQLKASFPLGKKELVVSSFQAIVLLMFNGVANGEQLSYDHLKAETGLPEADLNRTLQSLACAKLRPLTKHPKGRDINKTDTFTFNSSFKHEKYRVKINQIQLKETKEENKETHERVAADRNFETQAAVVRIMKSKKTIKHAELVAEVISATKSRGVLPVGDIKKNIDRLIEKEYLEREDDGSYTYLA